MELARQGHRPHTRQLARSGSVFAAARGERSAKMRKYMDFQEIYEILGRACTDSEIQEICEYISYDPCDIIFLLQTLGEKICGTTKRG